MGHKYYEELRTALNSIGLVIKQNVFFNFF